MNTFNPDTDVRLVGSDSIDLGKTGILESEFLIIHDSGFIVNAQGDASLIHVLQRDGRVSKTFGKEGRGPMEFLEVSGISVWPDRNENEWVGISDARRGQYVMWPLTDSLRPQAVYTDGIDWDVMVRLADGTFVCAAVADTSRFYLLDSAARVLDRTNDFPPRPDGIPLLSHSMACTGVLVSAPRQPVFANCVVYDGGVDVCRTKDGKIEPLWRFSQFDMDYDILPEYHNVPRPNPNSRYGYTSLCFSDRYLYALYSGNKMLDEGSEMGDEIHVFDYQGRHCKRYRLDRKIYELAVDENDQRLCGLIRKADGDLQLVEYAL